MQDVVRLYIPVQHVVPVHGSQAEGHFVQTVAAEVLRVLQPVFSYDVRERTLLQELKHDENISPVVVQVDAPDHLVTVEALDQASLLHDLLHLPRLHVNHFFHCGNQTVPPAPDLKHFGLAALADFTYTLPLFIRIVYLDVVRDGDEFGNFGFGAHASHALQAFVQSHVEHL